MAARRYLTSPKASYKRNDELQATLEDLKKSKVEIKDLKDNIQEADEYILKLKEQVKKFKEKYKEVSEQLISANESLDDLKVELVERAKVEEDLNLLVKSKLEECDKLEKEVVSLKSYLEKAKSYEEKFKISSENLDEMIASQKSSDDKKGLGFEKGESFKLGQENIEMKKNKATSSRIREEDQEDLRSGSQMLKGTHLSMAIVLITIGLVIRLLNVEVE